MTVIKHESNSKAVKTSFCYSPGNNTLQYSKEILNELNAGRNDMLPKYKYFEDEMEKIDSGDLGNISAVKLDDYFGSLGVNEEPYNVIEKERKVYGIC